MLLPLPGITMCCFHEPCCISWTACLSCTSNTKTSWPLHLPRGQAPSQCIHGHTSCSPCALGDGTCSPLRSCFPLGKQSFLGKGKWRKPQQFCLILANTFITKPLGCVCSAEPFLPPHTALAWSTQGKGSLSSSWDASLPIFTHTDDLLYYPT